MSEIVYLDTKYPLKRIIGKREDVTHDNALIFIGGIHGNEGSGYAALCNVFSELETKNLNFGGNVYALGGNLQALQVNKRYIDADLNRIWLHKNIDRIKSGEINLETAQTEELEFLELYTLIKEIIEKHKEVFVIDLHTTSAPSMPFITVNDMIINRKYSLNYPLPVIIGIEEYLNGPLLSYMNEYNYVSMAFEAGQHDDPQSLKIQESFVWTSMVYSGILSNNEVADFSKHFSFLKSQTNIFNQVFEVRFRKNVLENDNFVMKPGYENFSAIRKSEVLASDKTGELISHENGRIFMPLYQSQGSDGYFIVRKVPSWALRLSRMLRRTNFDSFLTVLPGINRDKANPHFLIVNRRIAKFLSNEIFHLLGYRRKKIQDDLTVFSRREIS